MLNRQTNKQI